MSRRLVADIGGTNSRIAIADAASGSLDELRSYTNAEFESFEAVLSQWLAQLSSAVPREACLAVAAPPGGDEVEMININWRFSCQSLAQRFGLERVSRLNDFEANALALPHLQDDDYVCLHAGQANKQGRLATLGPGTGLGGATIVSIDGTWHASACEPGHIGLSPANAQELALFERLLARYNDIFAELLVSGQGLLRLYQEIAALKGQRAIHSTPEAVSVAGLNNDEDSRDALGLFCALLGSACGDFVLANGAYGGLYLAGGIVPRILPFIAGSAFHARMISKGAMVEHLRQVPVYAITHPQPALLGAANYSH
ncbi:MAG: glucokinase [Pseudomonadota bacterium]